MMNVRRIPMTLRIFGLLAVMIGVMWAVGDIQAERQRNALFTALEMEQDAAKAKGEEPVAPPAAQVAENPEVVEEVTDDIQEAPPQSDPVSLGGISADDVRLIVQEEIAERQLELSASQIDLIARTAADQIPKPKDGKDGKDGADGEEGQMGPAPTQAEIRSVVEEVVDAVVTARCAEDGTDTCNGTDGTDGTNGTDSTVPGPQGPQGDPGRDATDEQVLAGIQTFCAEASEPCRGVKGDKGDKGDPGYPFQFVFTIPAEGLLGSDHTYVCNVTGPNPEDTACTEVE
jgi:hypothetical protein